MERLTFPVGLKLVIDALKGFRGLHVSSRVPSARPGAFLTILDSGGTGAGPLFRDVHFTVWAWSDTNLNALQLAEDTITELRHLSTFGGVPVWKFRAWGPPVILPDKSEQPRAVFTFSVRLKAQPA